MECFLALSFSGAKELPRVRTLREEPILTLIILSKNAQKRQNLGHAQAFLQASRKLVGTPWGKSLGSGQASRQQMAGFFLLHWKLSSTVLKKEEGHSLSCIKKKLNGCQLPAPQIPPHNLLKRKSQVYCSPR